MNMRRYLSPAPQPATAHAQSRIVRVRGGLFSAYRSRESRMRVRSRRNGFTCAAAAMALSFSILLPLPGWGQQRGDYRTTTAIDPSQSRAAEAAAELVSLSADKIISILREEPGLLLAVKKTLVRRAYEQGRILDPADLTDDALYTLLRDDNSVRVVATREIEDRYYIRPKPTREELERNPPKDLEKNPAEAKLTSSNPSAEEIYWSRHEDDFTRLAGNGTAATNADNTQPASQATPPPIPSGAVPPQGGPYPGMPSAPASPQPYPSQPGDNQPSDVRRQLLQAQNRSSDDFLYGGDQDEMMGMSRIRPDQLPAVLSASMSGSGMAGAGLGLPSASSNPLSMMLSPDISSLGSGLGNNDLSSFQQQASLQYPAAPRPSPPSPPTLPALRHRANPYADVPSLYELYAQYGRSPTLQRFGNDVFRNGTGNFAELPMDMPAGPEYVVGPGDGLAIEMWGGVSQRLRRIVDREGRLALPEVGTVEVAGHNLGEVQRMVQGVLRTQFRDVEADVSLARVRSVRVYVVGDVERPGAYDVSSLSTPLNAVYLAGGPTSRGSLRILQHYRGNQLLQSIDVYDLLLHGVRSDMQHLEPGDTVLVPPLGPEVTIEGMVRRPAIYELNGEKSLAEVLELAGGVLPSGTLRHVDVERVQAHESRTMLRLDIPENNNAVAATNALEDFPVQDGDKVKISPILPYADKTVYLDGHVFRPGKYAYRDGMKVSDLIKSYNDLLPEPYKQHAEIIRLSAPDYTPQILAFNLGDALSGKDQNLELKPFDTVRVFGRFDFEDPPLVTVTGEVRDPGDHITNGATYLRDAVYLAGGTTNDAQLSDAQVFRRTRDGKMEVLSVNLSQALAGDAKDNILLQPKDRVIIHRNMVKTDPAAVSIQGEVAKPGKYPLGEGMTAAELVQLAGGLKRGAYSESADLTRYAVEDGKKVVGEHMNVQIAKALAGEPDTDMRLHDGDVLTIGQLAGWKDVGASITVTGEVVHPGTYGIREGERLSSIIARAGGFRSDAYPYGSVFQRNQVREMEEANRSQLIHEVRDEGSALRLAPDTDEDQKQAKAAALQQWQTALEHLENTPPTGRLVIHIDKNPKRWNNSPADIEVRNGDSIYVPKRPNMVMVDGSVYNPTAVAYKPGKSVRWYLRQAGGPTNMAERKGIFVIRADGAVVGGSGGLFTGGVDNAALQPGDLIIVPEKAFSANSRWKNILEGAQLTYSIGIAIQVARSF